MSVINQKEYLKRYLSNDGKPKKKKKSKTTAKPANPKLRIVEDILDLRALQQENTIPSEEEYGEYAPQVAEVIDERPEHIKREELYKSSKWKSIEAVEVSETRKGGDSNDNTGPPLQGKLLQSNTATAWRIQRHDSDSDLSPERDRGMQTSRNARQNSDLDLSPPRSRRKQHSNIDDSDVDMSPPRPRKDQQLSRREDSDSDLSPLRSKGPQQRSKRDDSDTDLSPPRGKYSRQDTSRLKDQKPSQERTKREAGRQTAKESSSRTLSGLKAGLQDSFHLRRELQEMRTKEKQFLEKIGDEFSGRGAETVFRDKKTGKKRDLKEERRRQREEEAKKAEQQEKYMEWGKGLKQSEDQAKRLEDDLYEMSKPLARYRDDVDLENHLKQKFIDGDPMIEYMKKRINKDKGSGSARPVYQGPPPPPNRFDIMPGFRWDGVDRSNGFETKYFKLQANKEAVSVDAYKWSTQDM